jgi:hypothetical protein
MVFDRQRKRRRIRRKISAEHGGGPVALRFVKRRQNAEERFQQQTGVAASFILYPT